MNESKPLQHGCYAHLPGTGPRDTTCFGCENCKPKESRTGGVTRYFCSKWVDIKKAMGTPKPVAKPILCATPSCKYFEKRSKTPVGNLFG